MWAGLVNYRGPGYVCSLDIAKVFLSAPSLPVSITTDFEKDIRVGELELLWYITRRHPVQIPPGNKGMAPIVTSPSHAPI